MGRASGVVAIVLLSIAAAGCGPGATRVMVPPRIDLKAHEVVGVIEFNCSSENELGPLATQRFIDVARQDQGMVRIVKLGTESEVLEAVGQDRLDPAAFQAAGEKYGVQTIVTGDLVFSEVRPKISLGHSLTHIGVAADVQATLAVQMVEAGSGASLWSRSAGATQRIGGASFSKDSVGLAVDDPDNAYVRLVNGLVYAVTPEFRPTWEWRREPVGK
ncbi:MAG: hypothetical protein M1376_17350 [Planctomycetes bacterium]|nr:hypothetical protein [Planctomycetota bacterium]